MMTGVTRDTLESMYDPTPTGPSDVLANLGLVDPGTGRPLVTPDWNGQPSPDPRPQDDDFGGMVAQNQPLHQQGASQWDSPENPYLREVQAMRAQQGPQDPAGQARVWLQQQEGYLQSQAVEFYNRLRAEKTPDGRQAVPDELAQFISMNTLRAAQAEARTQAFAYATQDVAVEKVARNIARDHSTPQRKIDPQELLTERSAEAMAARARTLATTQGVIRDARFAARAAAGVDRREGGVPAGQSLARAYDDLSPQAMMRLGILRGD
jgi:hypothetical protein